MAKSKALLIALGGSVVGISGFFLPWISVSMLGERSISGFSLVRMLFGAGGGNIFQELGFAADFVIPAILLVLALIALLYTGVSSALMIRSNNANKTSGILLTIASGIVFLIVAGIALLVSIIIKGQVGSYVDVGSYIRYGVGFFVTSLSALVVMISGIFIFQKGELSDSSTLGHFGQDEISHAPASSASVMDSQVGHSADNLPPMQDPGLAYASHGYAPDPVFEGNQPNLQPNQLPEQQPYTLTSGQPWQPPQYQGRTTPQIPPVQQQTPYNQTPPFPGRAAQNQGWGLPPQPATPVPGQFQPPAVANPPQPWQPNQGRGWNQQPGQPPQGQPFKPPQPWPGNQPAPSNSFPNQSPMFGQRNPQQQPLNPANNQPPLDKPWERVRYNGPRQAPLTPRVLPVRPGQNFGQAQAWNQPSKPPVNGQEDPRTQPGYMTPLEDSDRTRYDRDLDNENKINKNDEYTA